MIVMNPHIGTKTAVRSRKHPLNRNPKPQTLNLALPKPASAPARPRPVTAGFPPASQARSDDDAVEGACGSGLAGALKQVIPSQAPGFRV